jgi:leucyl-tRNA synthetase
MVRAREQGAGGTPEWQEALDVYLRMMAPVAPHITEELWFKMGKPHSIHTQSWPIVDEAAAAEDMVTFVIQVNGKVRDRIEVPVSTDEAEVKNLALASASVRKYLGEQTPHKVIVVAGKLVNIVI